MIHDSVLNPVLFNILSVTTDKSLSKIIDEQCQKLEKAWYHLIEIMSSS